MDLKLVLHRTTIKSGKRSRVKNQSFKTRQVDVTTKFSTSLKDLENKKNLDIQAKGQYFVQNVVNKTSTT